VKHRVLLVLALLGPLTFVQAQQHWVATWGTAQQLARIPPPGPRPAAPAPPARPAGAAPRPVLPQQTIAQRGFNNQTVRMIAPASLGGRRLRVKLSNAFGSAPVAVGAAHVAIHGKESEIVPGTDRTLSFNGNPSCTLGPGMVILSDPVDLDLPKLGDLAVSLYFPGETGPPTNHNYGLHTTYISKEGDVTGQRTMADAVTTQSYYYLAGVDVLAPSNTSLIVTFGDSITDGALLTPDTEHNWPTLLAARLAANKRTAGFAVANAAISGNQILGEGGGANALARLDRDVLSLSGVKWMMLLEGINDIGKLGRPATAAEPLSAEDLIGGYRQIIEAAHTHGIKVAGCTLTPYGGAGYFTEKGEAIREAVNTWIRTSGAFDGVVDFDAATRDPNDLKRYRPEFDHGDHLHPGAAGAQAMANAIDLGIFSGKRAAGGPKRPLPPSR